MPRADAPLAQPLLSGTAQLGAGAPSDTEPINSPRRVAEVAAEVMRQGVELVRTASTQQDIETALSESPGMHESAAERQAVRAQRLRAQLRLIEADIVEARAELQRAATLRGPSGVRRTCDPDCMLGGCAEEFPQEEGVLCEDCGFFMCHSCFGSLVVTNECQVGGRFEANLRVEQQRAPPDPATSRPASPPRSEPEPEPEPEGDGEPAVGDEVRIYSKSAADWVDAVVVGQPDAGRWRVRYEFRGRTMEKGVTAARMRSRSGRGVSRPVSPQRSRRRGAAAAAEPEPEPEPTTTVKLSAPGSLPCPMFPDLCSCGHIPLSEIQRATLHHSNRGEDGDDEHERSEGLSPHKTFLVARRRWAESQVETEQEQGGEAADLRGVLLRSFSDLRRQVSTRRIVHTTASVKAAVAEKLNELEELTQELMARPAIEPVPLERRRTCAQCGDVFAAVVEGGQCMGSRPFDFLCSLCWGASSPLHLSTNTSIDPDCCAALASQADISCAHAQRAACTSKRSWTTKASSSRPAAGYRKRKQLSILLSQEPERAAAGARSSKATPEASSCGRRRGSRTGSLARTRLS